MSANYKNLFSGQIDMTVKTAASLFAAHPASASAFARLRRELKAAEGRRRALAEDGVEVPPLLIVSTTEACNLACAGCYACARGREPEHALPDQVVAEILDEASELGVGIVMLAGGEPLLSHGWLDALGRHGEMLGIVIAVGIVHVPSLDRSLMPWIITSQTIPILALAPMIIVVLAAVGVTGLIPKALISTYLSFFPVAVGMVKGLRSPEITHLDLMHTYSASRAATFWKLRLPASVPFLFASMKVAIAAAARRSSAAMPMPLAMPSVSALPHTPSSRSAVKRTSGTGDSMHSITPRPTRLPNDALVSRYSFASCSDTRRMPSESPAEYSTSSMSSFNR